MTLYELLKLLHVVGAIAWIGGGAVLTALAARVLAGRDADGLRFLAGASSWAGPRIFAPAGVVVIAFGVWAAAEGDLDFGSAWITIGFAAFLVAFLAGPLFHERNARALRAELQTSPLPSDRAWGIMARDATWSGIELAILLFAVWAMVVKPV